MTLRNLLFILLLGCECSNTAFSQTVTPQTALAHYLALKDDAYKWEVKDSVSGDKSCIYRLLLTSQKWHNIVWTHQLTIIMPKQVIYKGALLFIGGGSNKEGQPNWINTNDGLISTLACIAVDNKACVALLKQTPNQPLFNGLTEDALISYTLHQFQKDHDYTWPLLFPMVKSAIKAMDAVQEFTAQHSSHKAQKFLVSGLSKRGWTTWLTGASDPRVMAIAPMVIDVLNMPVSLDYQINTWHDYSVQIQDYVNLGIVQQSHTDEGQKLLGMVDPYSYRKKLTMPKMIFMGTNDEYWVVDNIKNYLDSIPGTHLLHYVPNAGHNLAGGEEALRSLKAFFAFTLQGKPYHSLHWETRQIGKQFEISIGLDIGQVKSIRLWEAKSTDADIRNNVWLFDDVKYPDTDQLHLKEDLPASGYKAFYVEVTYPDPSGGTYSQCSRVFVMDKNGLVEKQKSIPPVVSQPLKKLSNENAIHN
ncbi:PhoPQ-activated pathogenicity-related protein [bacterium A37T11]|nr:PhoPQ-activated pathogenicity-related protein [bacterium A37T11]